MPKVLPQYLETRRQQIIDAAAACFARSGFHRTTMQDICNEAELSPGAVYRYFQSKEDIIQACANFLVFLFLVTGFVYSNFFYGAEGFAGFVDALYFSVATVTTTGFGDIVLPGTLGKLTSIVTMIIGISLFVRLAQAIVRPYKVNFPCPQCGLSRHEADAVHCKACGHVLNIPDEGA